MNPMVLATLAMAQIAMLQGKGGSIAAPYASVLPSFGLNAQSEQQARADMTRRALTYRECFLDSQQARKHADTLGLFLSRAEYAKMHGNVIFGYWWASPGFVWKPEWRKLAFVAPKGVHESSRPIQPQAWNKAMEFTAARRGLTITSSAPIKITGAVVGAILDPAKEHQRGYATICEWKIQSPKGGVLLYRFGILKPSLGGAIGANLEWVVNYARAIDGTPKQPGAIPAAGTAREFGYDPQKP